MSSRRAKLHEDTNFRLMRILEVNPDLSQLEMGKVLGISFGGIHYCLNALVAKGLVKIETLARSKTSLAMFTCLRRAGFRNRRR